MVMNTKSTLADEDPASIHSRPSVRLCKVDKNQSGSCGFHLTRTKWDPYPWIAAVDQDSLAFVAGLKVGDCVLEVNGEDVLGLRISEIATKAQTSLNSISMLLWNAGTDPKCDTTSLCCTPMPTSLSRLSSCLNSILNFLECPVCFEIISPPAHQCPLGHLICFRCRVCIERCPVCRTEFTQQRSLLADQVYNSVVEAFHLKNRLPGEQTTKLWERIFGRGAGGRRDRYSNSASSTPKNSRATDLKNRFLSRLIGKSSSVDNLAVESSFSPALRKKSISSTDIYPESLKHLNYLHNSNQCSTESLPSRDNGSRLSTYSLTNSCEALGSRNLPYYNRLRARNFKDNAENLFQFSSDRTEAETLSSTCKYYCPLSPACSPLTVFSLLTHLQQHDGPLIQYFNQNFSIHFPLSFDNGAIVITHCYEKTFFVRIFVEDEFNDIKLCAWLMDNRNKAEQYKLKVQVRDCDYRTALKFKTKVHSIMHSTDETVDDVFEYQIVIANSTLQAQFQDKRYSIDFHFKELKI